MALSSAEEIEPHPYLDIRDLVENTSTTELGTDADPRFTFMQAIASGSATLPLGVRHRPTPNVNFSLYPGSPIIERVASNSLPLFEKRSQRIFAEKWPGIITAFDELLRADTAEELNERMATFYEVAARPGLSTPALRAAIETWAGEHGISEKNLDRLFTLAVQIRQKHIPFRHENIKRALGGAMPNLVRWYPPRANTVYLYYEVALDIPRNENEGKVVGWGSMQQWREPTSHVISPKLIYTTASKPNYGLKAFVVDDEWYVKLHGGTSQQYNYTGLDNPSAAARMDGRPNNLTDAGLELLDALETAGLRPDDLNFYIAAMYNSEVASEFLEQAGSGAPFRIRVPQPSAAERVRRACSLARALRDLYWLGNLAAGQEIIDADELDRIFPGTMLSALSFQRQQIGSRRFRPRDVYAVPERLDTSVEDSALRLQSELETIVTDLYSD